MTTNKRVMLFEEHDTHNQIIIKAAQEVTRQLSPRDFNPVTFDCNVYATIMNACRKYTMEQFQRFEKEDK